MKIHVTLLALGVFYPNVWVITAFYVQAPKSSSSRTLKGQPPYHQYKDAIISLSSAYLASLGGGDGGSEAVAERQAESGKGFQVVAGQNKKALAPAEYRYPQHLHLPTIGALDLAIAEEEKVENASAVGALDLAIIAGSSNLTNWDEMVVENASAVVTLETHATERAELETAKAASEKAELKKAASIAQFVSAKKAANSDVKSITSVWDKLSPVLVQGGSLRTWSFAGIERAQVLLKSNGRPLYANVELWQGPDNTPVKMSIYSEDGSLRPFSAVLETPRGQNAIAIRNAGEMEFPLAACVDAELKVSSYNGSTGLEAATKKILEMGTPKTIQGGALHTYPFDRYVSSVQIMLKTDGRPLNARIELLQGPNNIKQAIDLYCEDGMERPFFVVIETPGSGNVVQIENTASMEFPMTARVEPYVVTDQPSLGGRGGDRGSYFILDRQG